MTAGRRRPATARRPGRHSATPAVDLGTITVDKDGNVKGATARRADVDAAGGDAGNPSDNDRGRGAACRPTIPKSSTATPTSSSCPGDYCTAEAGFRNHIARFPADPKAADAHYWLGEALLGQKKYRDAAETFLAANSEYPKSAKAPDMLLKLGVSLDGSTSATSPARPSRRSASAIPKSSGALKERVKQEQALAAC